LLLWLITKDKKPEPPSDIVHLIIAQGVDVNAADDEGETALLWAAEYCFTSDVTEILKANGLDKNRRILSGPTRVGQLSTLLIPATTLIWLAFSRMLA
jgi:hypothetical protein